MATKEWNKENMRTISCRVHTDLAEKFSAVANRFGTTANAALTNYVKDCVVSSSLNSLRPSESLRDNRENLREQLTAANRKLDLATAEIARLRAELNRCERLVDNYLLH